VSEGRKASEVPKPEPAEPRDLGRGGTLHKAIQERLQDEARALGFFAEVERQLSDQSLQAADLVLRRGELAMAVEIAVTTTTDHEFGNVKKCLEAGFRRVAVVSPKPERLKQIAAAVLAGLGAETAAQVSFHSPDELIAELRKLADTAAPTPPPTPAERTTRGYKVRRHGPKLTPEERKAKEEVAVRMMAELMKRLP
jgi:hypothetical protein